MTAGAERAVEGLVADWDPGTGDTLAAHCRARLHTVCSELGDCIGLHQAARLDGQLSLLCGLARFLLHHHPGSGLLLSQAGLQALLSSLTRLCELRPGSRPVLLSGCQDFPSLEFLYQPELFLPAGRPVRDWAHLTQQQADQVGSLCSLLGGSPACPTLLQLLLEAVSSLPAIRPAALYLLASTARGTDTACQDKLGWLEEALEVCTGQLEEKELEVAARLEAVQAVGAVCSVLGNRVDLGPVLTCLLVTTDTADPSLVWALQTGLQDCAAGRDCSVASLLQRHTDCLTRELNLALRRPAGLERPGLPTLVRATVRLAPHHMADLQDTMDCLLGYLPTCPAHQTAPILTTVLVFVLAMQNRMEGQKHAALQYDTGNEERKKEETKGSITRMILELETKRKEEEAFTEQLLKETCPDTGIPEKDEKDIEEDGEGPEEEEGDPPVTEEQKWLQTVISHLRHFISLSGQPGWQLLSLNTVAVCLELLGGTEHQLPGSSQHLILPAVHQVSSAGAADNNRIVLCCRCGALSSYASPPPASTWWSER